MICLKHKDVPLTSMLRLCYKCEEDRYARQAVKIIFTFQNQAFFAYQTLGGQRFSIKMFNLQRPT